jgi:hypothetical protein
MRPLVLLAGLLATATPALACVCSPPESEAEKREIAGRIASEAVAIVDVEQVSGMDWESMRGETYRVVKTHFGSAPQKFELSREFNRGPDGKVQMAMTSCDEVPPPGHRTTTVLYATDSPGKFRVGSTCDQNFVNMPGGIDSIRSAAGKAVERG